MVKPSFDYFPFPIVYRQALVMYPNKILFMKLAIAMPVSKKKKKKIIYFFHKLSNYHTG
jgi:hypothetical protein